MAAACPTPQLAKDARVDLLERLGTDGVVVIERPTSNHGDEGGEQIPPCGIPASVMKKVFLSTKPAFSHLRKMTRSMGTCANNQSWLIRSKHDLMSPSSTHRAQVFCPSTMKHCSIASVADRPLRKP
jgi:hypothetical protein